MSKICLSFTSHLHLIHFENFLYNVNKSIQISEFSFFCQHFLYIIESKFLIFKCLNIFMKIKYLTKYSDYVPIAVDRILIIIIGVKIVVPKDFNKSSINGLVKINI